MIINKSGYVYVVRSGRTVKIGFALCHNLADRMKSVFGVLREYGAPELVGYVRGTMADEERAIKLGKRIKGVAFTTELFHLGSVPPLNEIFPGREVFTALPIDQEPSAGMTETQVADLRSLGREAIQWAKDITSQLIYADALLDRRMSKS